MKSINKKLLLLGKVLLIIIGLELLRESPFILFAGWPSDGTPYNSQGIRISRGLRTLGTINRAQQAYHYENQKFTSDLKQLDIDIDGDSTFSLESETNYFSSVIQTTTIYLSAKNYRTAAPLFYYLFYKNFFTEDKAKYTLSSAIIFSESNKYQTIFCASNTPGWQEINKPYLQSGELVCGEGTTDKITRR